ncbi:hypothetical protein FF38_04401 [Lucilia cuprina]|uniref:Uncharacterized protein n=1 Tax=Lucilia cuprina TaxID=7375 RepID=A0A0L0C7A7_LUCCU|nr:uncharacterized protein LOC111680194 [Lucilia cuprina]KAI8129381.1 hypothetical protein CVS40_1531 [Lucilia cuprina]KNC28155.1 hypothetical protein FF38_04401 [Lucilia cuprina]
MHWLCGLIVTVSCLLTLGQTQSYRYPAQRRAGYSYTQPSSSYYNQPKNYYQSSANSRYTPAKSSSSYYNSVTNPSYTNSYTKQSTALRNSYPYSSSSAAYTTKATTRQPYSQSSGLTNFINRNYEATPSKNSYYRNSANSYSKGSYNSLSDSSNTKQYLSNSYNSDNYKKDSSSSDSDIANTKGKNRVSKADAENAKFAGAENQENEEDARTAHLKRRKFHRRFGGVLGNPCSPFGRDAGNGVTPPPKEQGRILWDVNVYNVFPQTSVGLGCGGYGGFGGGLGGGLGAGLGGGLLSDPIAPAYYPPGAGIANFLGLFAPGILQNTLAVTARPPQYADYAQSSNVNNNDLQNDPEVDPNYRPGGGGGGALPVRRPNRVFYDSVGAPPITPGQLVGGIATTVNGIIQQLTGNVQPVYG